MDLDELRPQIATQLPWLDTFDLELAHAFVHEVVAITTPSGRYALKLYRPGVRTVSEVQWEVALHQHLMERNAPVVSLVGTTAHFAIDGQDRLATLTQWAPGSKVEPSVERQRVLGRAAALLHNAADDFESTFDRSQTNIEALIDTPLLQMQELMQQHGRWDDMLALADKAKSWVSNNDLDWGVCHNDLTFDNVHLHNDEMIVFDLDSATPGWRALEPAGTYQAARRNNIAGWYSWLDGYHEVRELNDADQAAVPLFSMIYEWQITAWRLGLTNTSVGQLTSPEEIPTLVDEWTASFPV